MTSPAPTPICRHLSRQYTNVRGANAVIEQAFFPGMGWCNTTHLPLPSVSAVRVLRDRGATAIAVGYLKPRPAGAPRTAPRLRARADFTVRECLA